MDLHTDHRAWKGGLHGFLRFTPVINWTHPLVAQTASELALRQRNPALIASNFCRFVRTTIRHSFEQQLSPTVYRASDVLEQRHGICHAQCILLVALLRTTGIPAGFSYCRVPADATPTGFCLHGLTAIHLPDRGWQHVDLDKDASDVTSPTALPLRALTVAAPVAPTGMNSFPHPDPLPHVIASLTRHSHWQELQAHLPDLPPGGG